MIPGTNGVYLSPDGRLLDETGRELTFGEVFARSLQINFRFDQQSITELDTHILHVNEPRLFLDGAGGPRVAGSGAPGRRISVIIY